MTREGEGGMIEEGAAKKRAVRKSKPFKPHPLFADFIRAAVEQSRLV